MPADRFGSRDDLESWSQKIHEMIDEMHSRSYFSFRDCATWQPSTNVYETAEAYFVCLELAGVDRERIDIQCVDPMRVRIRGTRPQPRPAGIEGTFSIHALEIDEGPFEREVELPEPVDVTRVEATYKKGYLWVVLPRMPSP